MIVPITCPDPDQRDIYTQMKVNTEYTMAQSLDCYVYRDAPERPLLIKADLLPHLSLALMLFIVPPMSILGALITCAALRGSTREHADQDEKCSQDDENSGSEQLYVSMESVSNNKIDTKSTQTRKLKISPKKSKTIT